MRKDMRLLSPLMSLLTERALAATVLAAGREWYLSDLAGHLGVTPSSLQRIVADLNEVGILKRRRDGNRVYYSADTSCPIFPELMRLLEKASTASPTAVRESVEIPEKLAVDL